MKNTKPSQQMKKPAIIFVLKAEHIELEITRFLRVARSSVVKVGKELEAADSTVVAECKTPAKVPSTIRLPMCVRKVEKGIIRTPECRVMPLLRSS